MFKVTPTVKVQLKMPMGAFISYSNISCSQSVIPTIIKHGIKFLLRVTSGNATSIFTLESRFLEF